MTRRQLLITLAFAACSAPLVAAVQKGEGERALQTVTLLIDGMT